MGINARFVGHALLPPNNQTPWFFLGETQALVAVHHVPGWFSCTTMHGLQNHSMHRLLHCYSPQPLVCGRCRSCNVWTYVWNACGLAKLLHHVQILVGNKIVCWMWRGPVLWQMFWDDAWKESKEKEQHGEPRGCDWVVDLEKKTSRESYKIIHML